MTSPLVEMRTVHDSLTANNRDRIYTAEAKERWLESSQNKTDAGYQAFQNTNPDWRDGMTRGFEMSRVRSETENAVADSAGLVDSKKLNLQPGNSFANQPEPDKTYSQAEYDRLTKKFQNADLQNPSGVYKFDAGSMVEFGRMLEEAKAGAQRNATALAADLATAMTLAGGEVSAATGNLSDWQNSELRGQLEGLKTALENWNTKLAESPLPSDITLRQLARDCGNKLDLCSAAHQKLMTSGGKEAVPFVKYELLATMRAIGEKVAAQYVARTGTASYSGLYELIRDVPRGPDDQAATKATDLVTTYQGDYATAWGKELRKLFDGFVGVSDTAGKELLAKFKKASLGVTDAFGSWGDNFAQLTSVKGDRELLRKTIAQVAFGLRRFNDIVDDVLGAHTGVAKVDGKTDKAKKLEDIRVSYHQTFDGFAQMLNQDIKQCVDTLKQS